MTSSLSNLVDGLVEEIFKVECEKMILIVLLNMKMKNVCKTVQEYI